MRSPSVQDGIARSYNWIDLALVPPYIVRPLAADRADGGGLRRRPAGRRHHRDASPRSAADLADRDRASSCCSTAGSAPQVAPGPQGLRAATWLATSLPDLPGRGLLSAADLHRHADAEAVPLARGGRGLLRGGQDARAGRLRLFLGLGRRPRTGSPSITSPATARGSPHSSRDAIRWTFWPSLAATALILALGKPFLWLFGPEFVARLSADVRARGRPAGARRGRPGRAAAQHAGRAAHLRAGLCASRSRSISVGCLLLIPPFGVIGAAIATALALVVEIRPAVRRDQAPARPRTSSSGAGAARLSRRRRLSLPDAIGAHVARSEIGATLPAAPSWQPLAAARADGLASGARLRPRARAQRVLRAGLRARRRAACSARDVGASWSGRGATGSSACFPARIERAPLRPRPAGAGRLDASLCAARRAAGRSRRGRGGDRGLARPLAACPAAGSLLLPLLPRRAVRRALARVRSASAAAHRWPSAGTRAPLLAPADRARRLSRARIIGRSKRKELRRQRRRLAEHGARRRSTTRREPAEIGSRAGRLPRARSRGWKGRAGTAAARAIRQCAASCAGRRRRLRPPARRASTGCMLAARRSRPTIMLRSGAHGLVLEDRLRRRRCARSRPACSSRSI